MKKFLILCLSVVYSSSLFSQLPNISGNKLSIDSSQAYIDSRIDQYEMESLKLYNDSMYYAAIDKFTKAGKLIDSLYNKNPSFSKARDYTITMCNIAMCGYAMKCFARGDSIIGKEYSKCEAGMNLLYKWETESKKLQESYFMLYAYVSFCNAEGKLAEYDPFGAYIVFKNALWNLEGGGFPKGKIFTCKYAIRSFSYAIYNTELGDYYKVNGDTATANLYYRKIIKK